MQLILLILVIFIYRVVHDYYKIINYKLIILLKLTIKKILVHFLFEALQNIVYMGHYLRILYAIKRNLTYEKPYCVHEPFFQ